MISPAIAKSIWQRSRPGITDQEVQDMLAVLYREAELKININFSNLAENHKHERNPVLQSIE